MERAISNYNNLGVQLYSQGRLSEARDAFRFSAMCLHSIASSYAASNINGLTSELFPGTAQNDLPPPTFSPRFLLSTIDLHESITKGKQLHSARFSRCEDYLLFVRDAHVVDLGESNGTRLHSSALCSFNTAGIVMNIGLTYLYEKSDKMLLFALNLFEIAYILVVQTTAKSGHHNMAESIALTCLNNAAQIQFALGNHALSKLYLDTLVYYIGTLPIAMNDPVRNEFRSRFMLNAVIMEGTSAACAA